MLIDLSRGRNGNDIAETAEKAMAIVRSTGEPHSVRGMIDLTGVRLNGVARGSMMKMSRNNGPYMKNVAFVGMGIVLSPVFRALLYLTGRKNHRVFSTRKEALAWLITH